jgi:hypothetical protein
MKKKYCLLLAVMMIATLTNAQEKKFSPEQFDAELQKFITWDAKLTPEEAAKFFPLYWEMQKKQRELYAKQQQIARNKPADDKGCRQIIKERDEIELDMKRVQLDYHNKFMNVLSPSKVYDALRSENKFHRHKMKQWSFGPKSPMQKQKRR